MRVEEELRCEGFNGFGGGHVLGKGNLREGESFEGKDIYCNKCPLAKSCWMKHRARVQLIAPRGAKAFDELCAKLGNQAAAMRAWFERYRIMDAYTLAMVSNLQDGLSVAWTGKVRDRGRWTLTYPFAGAVQTVDN